MKRLIVTDSTSDLSQEIIDELRVLVLPVKLILDGEVFKDRIDIKIEDFYERYDTFSTMSTAAVPYEEFALTYLQLTQKYDEILFVLCSSLLSKTYENILNVHNDFKDKHKCRIEIIDTKQCGMGLGLIVIEAAKKMVEGETFEGLVAHINKSAGAVSTYMAIPTLKYLKKSKRIGGMKAFLASAIGVRPVLGIDGGKLVVKTKLFGKQKNLLLALIETLKNDIGTEPVTLALSHAQDKTYVQNLISTFNATFRCRKIYVTYFGPSIGINTGPETMGVTFLKHSG
ncbi:putative DegV family protein [Desulfamplus magnetovallimortis]|uniref:Putative DegV family protein n=1 Tax=Desulfamplus magnetovallimortis TaxID=1246637 RepID=A0A1W1HCR9_9BACT|nr:DegV family protein [Desulfamplus magnetovallimortis]SLM30185.1 putative DegV family protein [Desulfamplus magnetovallimortis]